MSLTIGPETTIGALLEAYPEAERILIAMAPAFAKLRNPVVRRTVGKVATLEQAAKIGGVSLREMLQRLADCTGQPGVESKIATPHSQAARPDDSWLVEGRVVDEVNADQMLERGVHPIGRIREAVAALQPGEVVLLRSSFRPEPLIETMRRTGAVVYCAVQGSAYAIYFGRPHT
jgi:hypothetical protein